MSSTKSVKHQHEEFSIAKKAQKLGLPDRWLYCPPMGKIIAQRFLPMKTPLSSSYDPFLPEKRYQFHPEFVFRRSLNDAKIGLWIDLTKTSRYYDKNEIEKHGCIYKKMALTGHKQSPTVEETEVFIRCVEDFLSTHPNDVIAIHCTHGFNRTGFLIAAYLHDICDYAIDMAVEEFANCRLHGIYKQDYLNDLRERYKDGDEELVLQAPNRPLWEQEPLSDDDFFCGFYLNDVTVDQSNPILLNDHLHLNNENSTSAAVPSSSANTLPMFMDGLVPSVTYLDNEEESRYLRQKARDFCKFKFKGFPGSQPVSLEMEKNLKFLSEQSYMASWKADGMRYLVMIEGEKQVYAFDRENNIFKINDVIFLNRKLNRHIRDTLLDAEMIIEKVTHDDGRVEVTPRLLIYDIIVFENVVVGKENFNVRFQAIDVEIIRPRTNAFKDGRLRRESEPISIRRKSFWELRYAYKIFEPNFQSCLKHEVDGLIFQPVNLPYSSGRCEYLLKWKPPSLCTIDFKLKIEKEARMGELPKYHANLYVLHYDQPFAKMRATKKLQEYDQKIIECYFDPDSNSWEFLRQRTDKSFPNAYTTAISVCNTIRNPISQEFLFDYIAHHGYHLKRQPH